MFSNFLVAVSREAEHRDQPNRIYIKTSQFRLALLFRKEIPFFLLNSLFRAFILWEKRNQHQHRPANKSLVDYFNTLKYKSLFSQARSSRFLYNRDLQHQVNRKPQTANRSYAFAVSRCRDFKLQQGVQFDLFSSVQFTFISPKYNTIQEYIQEL